MNATKALDFIGARAMPGFRPYVAKCVQAIREERAQLLEALKEIARGEGAFSRDPLEHAENCIEHAKAIAKSAIVNAEATEASSADDQT